MNLSDDVKKKMDGSGAASARTSIEAVLVPSTTTNPDGTGPAAPSSESSSSASSSPVPSSVLSMCLVEPPPRTGDGDGEYAVLVQSLEEDSAPLTSKVRQEMKRTRSGTWLHGTDALASYGHPLSPTQATERIGGSGSSGKGGLVYHATLLPDTYVVRGKLLRGLNPRDFDPVTAVESSQTPTLPKIKPRRPTLPVTFTELFSSITKIDGPSGPRYIFYGVLNGWPSLRCLELVAIEARREGHKGVSHLPTAKEIWAGQIFYKLVWSSTPAEAEADVVSQPTSSRASASAATRKSALRPDPQAVLDPQQVYRITLRGAPWSSRGWSEDSPGFCFWFEAVPSPGREPKLSHGTDMLHELSDRDAVATRIHMVSHRYAYASRRETPRDRLTYHSVVLVEWDHGRYLTVMEAAYLNGMGGYKGKSNWYDDRDDPAPLLYRCLPPEMISPWRTTEAELRCYDVPCRTLAEFRSYVDKYSKDAHDPAQKRFVDPNYSFSHPCRLSFRTRLHIARYLLNYIGRDSSYGELSRNCQTFAADLCSFLAGKRNVPPFHPVNRIDYQNRTHLFLYEPALYGAEGDKQQNVSKK